MREHSKESWDVASKFAATLASETRDLAACIDVALAAERERCATVADRIAHDAQRQIEINNAYMARTGLKDETCNDLCRHKLYAADRIARDIRNLKSE